jgi:hypothetical protein
MESKGGNARLYRVKWWKRILALVFLAFVLAGSVTIWTEILVGERKPAKWERTSVTLGPLLGAYFVLEVFISTVTLFEDAIEVQTVFRNKRLLFTAIRGRREYVVRGGADSGPTRYLKLEPNEDGLPTLKFEKSYNFDAAFYRWFNALPDLDLREGHGPETKWFNI